MAKYIFADNFKYYIKDNEKVYWIDLHTGNITADTSTKKPNTKLLRTTIDRNFLTILRIIKEQLESYLVNGGFTSKTYRDIGIKFKKKVMVYTIKNRIYGSTRYCFNGFMYIKKGPGGSPSDSPTPIIGMQVMVKKCKKRTKKRTPVDRTEVSNSPTTPTTPTKRPRRRVKRTKRTRRRRTPSPRRMASSRIAAPYPKPTPEQPPKRPPLPTSQLATSPPSQPATSSPSQPSTAATSARGKAPSVVAASVPTTPDPQAPAYIPDAAAAYTPDPQAAAIAIAEECRT